ncbi:MAG: phytanoyl-CoA dioxygenase family protein [Leptospiraceae bacterium]|nr:phytanoyl-CoA dioxygenase family protein [Leptospiraceae bacterium]
MNIANDSDILYTNTSLVETRELIFNGKIILVTNCEKSKELARFAISFLQKYLKTENIREFEHRVSREIFFETLSAIKPIFSNQQETRKFIRSILNERSFNIETIFFDPVRLRSITSYAHKISAAKPAFAIHRDTWYANPEAQINWWIPLYDVDEKDTFSFYPDYFSRPVKNNSNEFDYANWSLAGGFQSTQIDKERIFPEVTEELNRKNELKIPCKAGDLLLFSASHLHGTTPNLTNHTRFSLDFRTVDTLDLKRPCAPNVDNKSTGSILIDMLSAKTFHRYQCI